jgi:hypothetical protein
MGRREKRVEMQKLLASARRQGIDLNAENPDLSVVTAHIESRYIQVITEKSSYVIDLEEKRALRTPGDDAAHLNDKGVWYSYDTIYSCSVSFPLRMTWHDGDRLIMRTTTPIVEVKELVSLDVLDIIDDVP